MQTEIGRILKPQGIRGEVKVEAITDDPSRFCVLKTVNIRGRVYRIENVRVSGNSVYLKFCGIDDRNAAESLRDAYISIDRSAARTLDEGEFFISDLIGSTLCARDGIACDTVGRIVSVEAFGAADVVTVDCDGSRTMSFAFVKALDARFDESDRVLTVDSKRLAEVAVYED